MTARIEVEERARLSHYSTLDRPHPHGEGETSGEVEAGVDGEAGEQGAGSEEEEAAGDVAKAREQEEDWETGEMSNSETDETRLSSRRDAARIIDAHAQVLMFNELPPSALPPTLDPPGLSYTVPQGFALVPVRAAPPTPPDSESDGPDTSPAADADVAPGIASAATDAIPAARRRRRRRVLKGGGFAQTHPAELDPSRGLVPGATVSTLDTAAVSVLTKDLEERFNRLRASPARPARPAQTHSPPISPVLWFSSVLRVVLSLPPAVRKVPCLVRR